jgi:GNAT superfamily N-acetyltransferase
MKQNASIREFQSQDEDLAIRLLVSKLPPGQREAAYEKRRRRWRWQYYDNPHNIDGRPFIFTAQVGEDFAGMVCAVPVRLRTPQGTVLATWGTDFIVNPEIRGVGVGKKLLLAWIKRPDVCFVLGYTPVSLRVAQSVGFEEMGGFTTARIVLSRWRFALDSARASRYGDLYRLGKVFLRGQRGWPRDSAFTVEIAAEPDARIAAVWQEVARAYRFCVERDLPYLQWRYCAHPDHKYHFVHLQESGTPCALAVVRFAGGQPPLGVIDDLIVDPRRQDRVGSLLEHTLAYLRSLGAATALLELPGAHAGSVLNRYRCSLAGPLNMILYTPRRSLLAAGIQSPDGWLVSRSDADQDY